MGWLTYLNPAGSAGPLAQAADQPLSAEQLRELTVLVFYLVLVLIIFLFGMFAIRRASQRFRSSISHERPKPTRTDDIWSMHQVPDLESSEPIEYEDDEDSPWKDPET